MRINSDKIKQLRQERGWTQSHLAELCDVSLRTIQRIENQGVASGESLMALSAVFEVNQTFLADNMQAIKQDTSENLNNYTILLMLACTGMGSVVGAIATYYLFAV